MNIPVRHHWWPQLQSGYWTANDGCINRVDNKGNVLKSQPINFGVKKHLYSQVEADGSKNTEIETWFSKEIDSPFDSVFLELFNFSKVKKHAYKGNKKHFNDLKEIGFEMSDFVEVLPIKKSNKQILSNYIAGLLVRTPYYINKLIKFHEIENAYKSELNPKNLALSNMLWVYELYRKKINSSDMTIVRRVGNNEFIYGDRAVTASEPWGRLYLPFTIHAPITPDFAVEVFPFKNSVFGDEVGIWRAKNRAVSKQNRIVLGNSQNFVFTRQSPPINFIKKNFGVPAPAAYGHRMVNGEMETIYDRSRDRH